MSLLEYCGEDILTHATSLNNVILDDSDPDAVQMLVDLLQAALLGLVRVEAKRKQADEGEPTRIVRCGAEFSASA